VDWWTFWREDERSVILPYAKYLPCLSPTIPGVHRIGTVYALLMVDGCLLRTAAAKRPLPAAAAHCVPGGGAASADKHHRAGALAAVPHRARATPLPALAPYAGSAQAHYLLSHETRMRCLDCSSSRVTLTALLDRKGSGACRVAAAGVVSTFSPAPLFFQNLVPVVAPAAWKDRQVHAIIPSLPMPSLLPPTG